MEVLYLGPQGSYSNAAAELMFRSKAREGRPADNFYPVASFEKIFHEITKNIEKIAVLPIENSIAGDVVSNMDKLFSGKYKIAREIFLKINHNLLLHKESEISKIKKVLIDHQIKIQCSEFLKQYPDWEQVIVSSTSEGAKMISSQNLLDTATIASQNSAEIYSLKIATKNIANEKNNYTRFIALIRELADFPPGNANKCSVSFEVIQKSGSLYKALKALHDKKYDLTKISTRAIPDRLWEYRFYIDFTFNDVLDLSEFEKVVHNMRIIGIYEKGRIVQG